MKFAIEKAVLLKTLGHVQNIVERRNTVPVLSNVRIEADANGISFKATDMDTEITEIAIIVNINKSRFILSFSLRFLLLLGASYPGVSNPHRYTGTLPVHSSPNQ